MISDPAGKMQNDKLVRNCDIILFAVPLSSTVAVIRDLVPRVRSHQLLMDLTSLKEKPVREMLRSKASVVGLHPMFGGRVTTFEGQTLIACPERIEQDDWKGLRRLFEAVGMRIKECSLEEHDRMMSIVQVLFHLNTMLIGRVLRNLGVDIKYTLEFTSPSYLLEMDLLGRIFAQNSELYAAITQLNPYTGEIVQWMQDALVSYEHWYDEQNLDAFIEDFEKSALHLGDFCKDAFRESSDILEYVIRRKRTAREASCARDRNDRKERAQEA